MIKIQEISNLILSWIHFYQYEKNFYKLKSYTYHLDKWNQYHSENSIDSISLYELHEPLFILSHSILKKCIHHKYPSKFYDFYSFNHRMIQTLQQKYNIHQPEQLNHETQKKILNHSQITILSNYSLLQNSFSHFKQIISLLQTNLEHLSLSFYLHPSSHYTLKLILSHPSYLTLSDIFELFLTKSNLSLQFIEQKHNYYHILLTHQHLLFSIICIPTIHYPFTLLFETSSPSFITALKQYANHNQFTLSKQSLINQKTEMIVPIQTIDDIFHSLLLIPPESYQCVSDIQPIRINHTQIISDSNDFILKPLKPCKPILHKTKKYIPNEDTEKEDTENKDTENNDTENNDTEKKLIERIIHFLPKNKTTEKIIQHIDSTILSSFLLNKINETEMIKHLTRMNGIGEKISQKYIQLFKQSSL